MKKKIGEVLIEKNLVTQEQIDEILKEQKHSNKLIGELLVEKQILSEILLFQALAHQHRMGFVDLEVHKMNPDLIHKIPLAMAQAYSLLPLELREGLLLVAVSNPRTSIPTEEIKNLTGAEEVQTVLCLPDQIQEMIRKKY
ncbi:MAG: hypothetical protein EXS63_00890 [Candidatus Omnitrophica bacterium]|nr:hypothetical protein [Candidatus Omnitrophota bacterium]